MTSAKGKLLSILGTTNYVRCNYDEFSNCKYIQEALIRKYKDEISEVIIFATNEAINENWESKKLENGDDQKGLKETIEEIALKYKLNLKVKLKKIPEGFTQEQLWEIFNIFIGEIEEGEEIHFDVTHGFRYLSMLIMNILNYVKVTKNTIVKSIDYGLIESLGPMYKVKKLSIEERNATILDLTSFDNLNDWVIGVDNFTNTGDADKISKLASKPIGKQLSKSGSEKEYNLYKFISILINKLKEFNHEIKTARGNKLNSTIIEILNILNEIEEAKEMILKSHNEISPFFNLIDKINEKFSIFNISDESGIENYFKLLSWCEEHNLVHQGFVIFRENFISLIARSLGEPYLPNHFEDQNYNFTLSDIRQEISSAINDVIDPKHTQTSYKTNKEKYQKIRLEIENNHKEMAELYSKYRGKRNDVSHFGLTDESVRTSNKVIKSFSKFIKELESLL
ncbi:MAG: TIGR02221 family CRISPR-associated protein [Candidatus Woesearchaeota archaeon]